MKTAVASNPTLEAAAAEARAAAGDLGALERDYLPTVSLNALAGAERYDDPVGLTPEDNNDTKFARQIELTAELVVFDGYRRANRVYQSAAALDGSLLRYYDASEALVLNTVEAYVDVARHRQLVAAATRNLARHRELGDQVRLQVEGGQLPASSQLQVEDRISAAEIALLEVKQALADAGARYERVVGAKPGSGMQVPRPAGLPGTQDDLVRTALRNSFRLQAAQTDVDNARYNKSVVESNRLPQVSLNAGARYGQDLEGSSGEESDVFVGLNFRWELFSGGRNPESRALAERVAQEQAERDEALREIRALAQQSWNLFQSTTERVLVLERQLRSNRTLVRRYVEEFEASNRTLLDVLEAERALFRVELQKLSADSTYAFSQYRILAVQSRLAQHFGIKPLGVPLDPSFQARALSAPQSVFDTTLEPLQ